VDDDMISPSIGLKLGYTIMPELMLTVQGGYGTTFPKDPEKTGIMKHLAKYPDTPFETNLIPILANFQVNFKPEKRFNPYFNMGWGLLMWDLKSDGTSIYDSQKNALYDLGIGFDYFLSNSLGLDVNLLYQQIIFQDKDMSGYGDTQSGIIEFKAGINLYLGGNKDKDGDGILNKDDQCPNDPEDMDGFKDTDGCPDLDNDNDGIPDLTDQSPNEAEDIDGFQDDDGIPDSDNDNDGIPDDSDECPNEAETINGYEDEDGCPDKKPEIIIEKEAPIILEGVTFETGSTTLTSGAKDVLNKVIRTMVDYPEMILEVGGYTDNRGSRQLNLTLSQKRADAVKEYMIEEGISEDRIHATGHGPDNPVESNDTAEGRAKNRRIEFKRLQ